MMRRVGPLAAISLVLVALLLPATVAAPITSSDVVFAAPEASGVVDWLKSPPPSHTASVVLKGENTVVGVVLPADIQPDQKVSGTAVILPANANATADVSGEVELETPDGKRHTVKSGDVITFVAAAGGAIALLGSDHKTTAKADCPLAKPGAPATPTPKGPVIVQNNAAVSLPIPSDGDAGNTLCKIGGQPAKVIAAKPGEAIVVPQGVGNNPGRVAIEAECNGEKATLEGWAVHTTLTAPPHLHVGARGTAKLTVSFGEKPPSTGGAANTFQARVTNLTPGIVSLGGKVTQVLPVDMRKTGADGTCEVNIPFTALAPGTYTINSTITSDPPTAEGCHLTCTGCEGWGYILHYALCSDTGTVNCYGTKGCGGNCAGHRAVGGPCGFWLCSCKWGKCHCK